MRAGHGPHTRLDQRGNVFAMLFGAVALTGVLAAVGMQTLTGPVTTITRVTQRNVAETNLLMSAKIIVNAAIAGTSGGDADGDGIIEPAPFVAAGGSDVPANGGFLPTDLGLNLTDPWGTRFGYCVWDHGTTNSSTGRISGDDTAGADIQPVIAIVTAGPDKSFQTICSAYSGGTVDAIKSGGSDDIILKFTYAEATASSNGLWTLNTSNDANAELKDSTGASVNVSINRDTGIGDFLGVTTSTIAAKFDVVTMDGGLQLDDEFGVPDCIDAGDAGVVRYNSVDGKIELCDGLAWVAIGAAEPAGSVGEIQFNDGAGALGADSNLFWDNTGKRLGIGTMNPAAKLQVSTLGAASDLLRFETDRPWRFRSTGTGADSDLQLMSEVDSKNFRIVASDGTTRAMEILATVTGASNRVSLVPDGGNVGIGTTNPLLPLSVVNAAASSQLQFGVSNASGGYLTSIAPDNTVLSAGAQYVSGAWVARSNAASHVTQQNGSISFWTNTGLTDGSNYSPSRRMMIDTSGNVGIGTTAPNARLQLGNLVDADPTNVNMIRLWEDVGSSRQFGIGISAGQQNYRADRHVFFTPSSAPIERMRVDLNGNVGIGTTNPQTRLDVNGSLRIGNDAASCTASKEGAIKYVSGASPPYKYCDGTSWTDFSQVGGGAGDTAPNSFVFTDLTGQTFSALISSNTITLAGLDNPPELGVYTSISGQGSPQFRINGGTWVTSGYVNDGDTVQLRLTTSGSSLTTHSAVLTVGTASDTWSVTTTNQDNTPNAFAFTDLTGQGLAATISSNTLTINGIGPAPVSVSVSGAGSPQISINGGSWGTTGSISNGQTLRVRLTSANTSSTARSATITVGTVSDSWSVTTATVTAGSQTFSSAGTFTFTVPHHQTLTVKVWGGGGGGAGCTSVNEVAGGNGGNSSWASSVYGNGGKKASASAGGAGGTASGGTTNQTGGTGGTSGSNGAKGGNGASGGAGGAQRTSNGNGHNGSVPGGGGGGARLVARGSCNGDGGGGGGYATRTYAAGTYTQGTSVTVVVGASGSRGNGSSYKGGTGGVGRVTVSWN